MSSNSGNKGVEMNKSRLSYRWMSVAAAGLLAVALGGCSGGGGGGGGDTTAPPLSGGGAPPAVAVPSGAAPITLTSSTPAATFAALAPVVKVGGVSISSPACVSFSMADANNNAIIGFGSTSQSATASVASYPNLAFSLAKLAEDMVSRFHETAAEKEIEIGVDVPGHDAVVVSGDRDKIEVALSNLIRNALTFTDRGGQIGVKVESEGGYARVFVVDTGIGIPAGEIDRVFERFYQVESHLTRKHGGMGLGLPIAKAMVEMHSGQIWCESREGMGSLFCFMIPVDERQAAAVAKVFKTA